MFCSDFVDQIFPICSFLRAPLYASGSIREHENSKLPMMCPNFESGSNLHPSTYRSYKDFCLDDHRCQPSSKGWVKRDMSGRIARFVKCISDKLRTSLLAVFLGILQNSTENVSSNIYLHEKFFHFYFQILYWL